MILEVRDLNVSYGRTPVLRDVDLDIDDGEIVGVMGRNGAGKTTLLRSLIGELFPESGRIVFRGEDVTDRRADERARLGIGYIPQGREIFPRLTVEENLRMGELIHVDSEDMLTELVYEYFPRLKERRTQKGGSMSGGEQQMLAIGRALIGNPDLLLLDEPSEGIQPTIVQQITRELQSINADLGTTILFVEQNLKVIQNLSKRSYVVQKGTIVDELSPEELHDEAIVDKYLAV